MIHSKLLDNKNENNNLIFSENLYKGACVKIKNSNKTFQVIGLNIGKEILNFFLDNRSINSKVDTSSPNG